MHVLVQIAYLKVHLQPANHAAFPGNMIHLTNCNKINLINLELDGNSETLNIGGYYSDPASIPLPNSRIYLNRCKTINVSHVFSHNFGGDGIQIARFVCGNDDPFSDKKI